MKDILEKSGYEVLIHEANHDAKLQNKQILNMVDDGARVIIAVAEDGDAMTAVVDKIVGKRVEVIAYDRVIQSSGIGAYISFDNVAAGRAQAEGVLARRSGGRFVLLGGSRTDNAAVLVRRGHRLR